jgi:hypothetical protein
VRMYKESTVRDAFAKYPPADGATDSVNHR